MNVAKLVWQVVGVSSLSTGAGVWLIVPAFGFSAYVRKFGYGDDWLIVFPIIAGLLAFALGLGMRKHLWIHGLGMISLAAFFALLSHTYAECEAAKGLGAALGSYIVVALAITTAGSFVVALAITVIAFGMLGICSHWTQVQKFLIALSGY